jgi:hypothetical protein
LALLNAGTQALPQSQRSLISKVQAPYFKNWKGSLRFVDGVSKDQAYEILTSLRAYMTQNEQRLLINGRKLYPVLEQPEWVRARNAVLARASEVFREARPDIEIKSGYPSGELWAIQPREIQLGKYNRWNRASETVFKWSVDVQRVFGLDPVALTSRLDELLS